MVSSNKTPSRSKWKLAMNRYGGFLSHAGIPSSHPFIDRNLEVRSFMEPHIYKYEFNHLM